MKNLEKMSFIGLLLLALLLVGLLAYNHKELMQPALKTINPFRPNHVAKIHIVMNEDDWSRFKTNPRAEQYVRADFWFDGEPYKNVAVRPKGMSSLMSSSGSGRLPLKIDFNFFNFAQTFKGIKKLNLNNGFSDPTFIRETIGYELFEQMDLPTPRHAFADVWVNNTHLGLYTIVEQVDKTFIRRNFASHEGNLYKPETPAAALNWTKDDVDKQSINVSQPTENSEQRNLDIKVGGTRLGDLVKVLKREGVAGSSVLPDDTTTSSPLGPFPGGPGGMFPGPPEGQFPGDPNAPFARGARERFGSGPRGQFPDDPNSPFARGARERFGGGPGRQFPRDPNSPFARGRRGRFGDGPRGQFPGDPNSPFGRRERDRFGGGPGGRFGPFGRRGNLLEQMGLKTNENYPDHSALFRFLEVLNKSSDEAFPSEIEKVLDVDGFLRFLAVSVLIVHLDNYIGMGHNYYLYEIDGKFHVVPWDLNMAFGTFGMGANRGGNITDFYIDEPVTGAMTDRPLVTRILAHKPYLDKYHQHIERLLNEGFSEGVIEARIDEVVEMIKPFVEADDLKFFSTEDFEKSINEDLASNGPREFPPGMGPMPDEGNQQRRDLEMFSPPEMDRSRETFAEGPDGGRQGRRGPFGRGEGRGPGMNAPGLKSFIEQRRLSVRQQLDGDRPSRSEGGEGAENNGMFGRFRGNWEGSPE